MRRRLDAELVRRRLVSDPAAAQAAIGEGRVLVDGNPAAGPATMVGTDQAVVISAPRTEAFVSRGGEKLDAAFERFSLDPKGLDALDAGASTGGFTDCLLRRGASRVVAVDVGYGDLAWSLRTDPRVTVFERTNVRTLDRAALPFIPSFVVADLSFVSLGSVVGTLAGLACRGAT
ncbi:MAG: SAM-dependent methyltransferase, partial [Actinomycetota bacterium]